MNEQIIKLAKQAGLKFPSETELSPAEKKFAELIVRECVGLVNEQLQTNNPNDSLLALKIKEHFGVLE